MVYMIWWGMHGSGARTGIVRTTIRLRQSEIQLAQMMEVLAFCAAVAGTMVRTSSALRTATTAAFRRTREAAPFSEIVREIISKLPQKLALAGRFQHYATTSVSWDNKDARSCINQVFYELNKVSEHTFSWHIRKSPVSKPYPAALNVHRVRPRQQWHTRIEATRPLAEALKILERNFRDTITYESVPPVSFSVTDKPARVALTGFLKSINKYLSWQLFYDPKSKEYVLNIHDITAE
jgi:hypothetical protein